jgi:neutral ceramidase
VTNRRSTAGQTNAGSIALAVGYGSCELVPRLPFPLAGTVHRKDRLSGWVDDPPQVVATVFASGPQRVAVVGVDILIIDHSLLADVEARALALGISQVFLFASHTHSSMGGYVDNAYSRFFMGRYRPDLRAFLLDQIAAAIATAKGDVAAISRVTTGRADVPGLTMNRRRHHGPTDDTLLLTEFERVKKPPVALVGISGHPVIACFMDPSVVSSDVPGRIRQSLAERGVQGMVLPGALGGLSTLFPELPTHLHDHLSLLETLISGGLDGARHGATDCSAQVGLSWGMETLAFTQDPPPFAGGPPLTALRSLASNALGRFYARRTAPVSLTVPVSVVRLGPVALAGMPADFGVAPTLQLRGRLERQGSITPYVVSHANGYVGYLHLRDEAHWQPSSHAAMHHYENAMCWYGRDATERLIAAAGKVHQQLSVQPD